MINNRNTILFIASSLDGYIATKDDSLEWLFKVDGEGDNGYSEFYDTVDTIVMGRRTYDWIIEKEMDQFPYKNKKCFVFSKSLKGSNEYVEFIDEDIRAFVEKQKQLDGGKIWIVGGGDLLLDFLKEQLIDEFIITIAPTLIGSGIPLFKEFDTEIELELIGLRRFNQFVELHYIVK
ncbi:MAG: dihydrofolate reductase [Anaerocolumna sp.]|nr:dihydrofolate reductase [Anaerocolumna sp.]